MALPLGPYCAYWFLQKQLGSPKDTDPPEDGPLIFADRKKLARQILTAIETAALTTGKHRVDIDPDTFLPSTPDWSTLFDVVESMLKCARQLDGPAPDPKAPALAFADYMATRWIYRRVLHESITARPVDAEGFPQPYDADAKRGLAETLASYCSRIGVELKNPQAFVANAPKWRLLSDPRAALLKQVGA